VTHPDIERLPPDCRIEDILGAADRDGGVIVEGFLDPDLLARFNAELDPWIERHPGTDAGSDEASQFIGRHTRRLHGLCAKAPSFVEIMLDERLLAFAEHVLSPVTPQIILQNGELIDIGPGQPAQPLHRDDDSWRPFLPLRAVCVNSITALVDVTPEMGGTLVVPGSHRWELDRVAKDDEVVALAMPAGASLLFRGDTLHAGGANTTPDRNRRALSTAFCCGWLRPVENSYTNVPLEVVRELPRRAQELLGYALYDAMQLGGGNLGFHEVGDPMKLFE
jgi:ectoine hydroxylase-related dioxygenase (phytanoyl-CoA dioxygenase family)